MLLTGFSFVAAASLPTQRLGLSGRMKSIPQCSAVTLSAAYLAQVSATEGPGFLLVLTNSTAQTIKLVKPFPSSVHWYARADNGHWLWRASSGSGGALVNALQEHGPLLAYSADAQGSGSGGLGETLTVGPHAQLEVVESIRSNPILRFRPGCEHCRNPQDGRFQAVLAYAYLPVPGEPEMLACGLRSSMVVMPPLE